MAVPVRTTPQVEAGVARPLFTARIRNYSVSGDGQRFLINPPAPSGPTAVAPPLTVVVNWFNELKRRAPGN